MWRDDASVNGEAQVLFAGKKLAFFENKTRNASRVAKRKQSTIEQATHIALHRSAPRE
jgi:hypothetical protein